MEETIVKCQQLVQALESQKQSYNVLLMEDIIDILAGKTTPEKVGDKWISIKQCNNTLVDESDKKTVIDLAKTHPHLYKYFNYGMRCDRDVFIEYVIADPKNYNHGPSILRNDKSVVCDLVTRNGSLLEYLEDKYKCDKEIIRLASIKDLKSVGFEEELFSKALRTFERRCGLDDLAKFTYVEPEPKSNKRRLPHLVQTIVDQELQDIYSYNRESLGRIFPKK